MEEILNQIESLKGVLLLHSEGTVYIIEDVVTEVRIKKNWLFKKSEQLFVTNLKIRGQSITLKTQITAQQFLLSSIQDRAYFIKMSTSLKKYNCRIISYKLKNEINSSKK